MFRPDGDVVGHVGVDHRAVRSKQPPVVDDAVIDARRHGMGVLLGGEDVDPSCAVGGVPDVGPSGSVQEPPPGSPHDAFVVGHEEVRVETSRANERIQAAITARVHVGVRHRNAMIECAFRSPLGAARRIRNPPAGERVGGVRCVHRDVAAVSTHVQRRGVVVVVLEMGVEHRAAGVARSEVERDDLDIAVTCHAACTGSIGNRADDEGPSNRIDDGPLVLEPGPRPVVVEHDDLGHDSATFARAVRGTERGPDQHRRCDAGARDERRMSA